MITKLKCGAAATSEQWHLFCFPMQSHFRKIQLPISSYMKSHMQLGGKTATGSPVTANSLFNAQNFPSPKLSRFPSFAAFHIQCAFYKGVAELFVSNDYRGQAVTKKIAVPDFILVCYPSKNRKRSPPRNHVAAGTTVSSASICSLDEV